MEEEGDGRPERGNLRQSQVHKDHLASKDVETEVRMDPHQHEALCQGQRHHLPDADISCHFASP